MLGAWQTGSRPNPPPLPCEGREESTAEPTAPLPRRGGAGGDGRMETTYRLRPNLTWHDGTPLTAEDFVFSLRMYSTPALGLASLAPFNAMEEVAPVDPRTIVIRWRRPYPDADQLAQYTFPPL